MKQKSIIKVDETKIKAISSQKEVKQGLTKRIRGRPRGTMEGKNFDTKPSNLPLRLESSI